MLESRRLTLELTGIRAVQLTEGLGTFDYMFIEG
jgi:hypothetical protein